jgi:hypothetical protein
VSETERAVFLDCAAGDAPGTLIGLRETPADDARREA